MPEKWRYQDCSHCGAKRVYIDNRRRCPWDIRLSICPECGHTLTVSGFRLPSPSKEAEAEWAKKLEVLEK